LAFFSLNRFHKKEPPSELQEFKQTRAQKIFRFGYQSQALALRLRHGDVGTASLPERCFVVARDRDRKWLSRKPKLMGTLKLFIGEFLQASLDSFDGYGSHLRLRFAFALRYCS
jgi:hypothetical protein